MKLFKNIMSRKPDQEETVGKIDLDMDVEPLRRRSEPLDDSGRVNSSLAPRAEDPLFADPAKPSYARAEEPEEADGAGWGASWDETDWDDDEDWGDDDMDDPENDKQDAARPKSEGRDWSDDTQFGRRAIARSQLTGVGGDAEDRILKTTNSKMGDRETSRRRSAMAHLKAAAAATKADRVLKHVASRDPSGDPEQQSPYRDDLAKVVRPRTTSRPISRPASRQRSITPPWDQGAGDEDAAKFAAAAERSLDRHDDDVDAPGHDTRGKPAPKDGSRFADDTAFADGEDRFAPATDRFATDESAFEDDDADFDDEPAYEGERAAHIPDDLSEEDFSDAPSFSVNEKAAFDRFGADEDDDDEDFGEETAIAAEDDDDDFDLDDGPVASNAVSEAVAMANAPDEKAEIDDSAVRRQIWDVAGDTPVVRDPAEAGSGEEIVNVATAVTGRAGRSAGRVKTRLLGFQSPDDAAPDVFESARATATIRSETKFPVGWIIVVEGPGRGSCYTLFNGVSQIGRGEDQAVRLDFGDTSISRDNHAAVAYDDEQAKFYLGHGGKSNLVRLNGRPVLSTEELADGDAIRIGETTLKFVSLCGEDFTWKTTDGEDADNGENA